jgi:hypothetical protein
MTIYYGNSFSVVIIAAAIWFLLSMTDTKSRKRPDRRKAKFRKLNVERLSR